ncbi:MAG TPA: hypothetical protein VE959_08215 [Bryobacteraceae bacterium]|nr:hypothetical protein [Bryobacteraceae bacterium]
MKQRWKKTSPADTPARLTTAPPRAAWRKHVVPVLALWGLALLAYSTSFGGGFPFDNGTIILNDTRVRAATAENARLIWTQEYWYGTTTTGLYRPLTTFSYLLNYAVFGNRDHAAPYHWVNFALHAANMLLVYLLGLLVLGEMVPALAMAALWGVHPVLTESVTNIVGRADLLAAFGVLAGLLCYVRSTATSGRRKALWLAGSAAAVLIGQFSKESAVVVLAAAVLYDLAFGKAPLRARWPGYAAMAAPVAVYLYVRYGILSGLGMGVVPFCDNPLTGAGFWTAEMTAVKVIGKYFGLLVWPARLSNDYSYNQVPLASWHDWQAAIALLACLGAAALAIWCFRRKPAAFFLVTFFFAALAPTSNVVIHIGAIMAERFLYLPAIGFAGYIVVAIYASCRNRSAAQVVLGVLCLAFAARSWARNLDWRDDETLWASAARNSSDSFKPHLLVAGHWLDKPGGLDRAIEEVDRAVGIVDALPDEQNVVRVYAVAGMCYRQKGDAPKSLALLLHGQRIDLAALEAIRRDYAARGRVVYPSGWPPLYLELGRTWMSLNEPKKALEALDYGSVLRPDAAFFEEMADAWRAMGQSDQAAAALIEGIALIPDYPRFGAELVDLYRQTAPQSCALRNTGGGLAPDLGCLLVHGQVCTASRNAASLEERRGRRGEAAATRLSAVRDLGCPAAMFQ